VGSDPVESSSASSHHRIASPFSSDSKIRKRKPTRVEPEDDSTDDVKHEEDRTLEPIALAVGDDIVDGQHCKVQDIISMSHTGIEQDD
jgi:hypothetical protein